MRRFIQLVAGAGLLISCSDATGPDESRIASSPAFQIFDARNGGEHGFYFLPPLAPSIGYSGEFDPARRPIVEICVLSAGSCGSITARFTLGGTGTARIRVDSAAQTYTAQWRTPNEPGSSYRIKVVDGSVSLGHVDITLLNKSSDQKSLGAGAIGIVKGSTIPITFRIAKSGLGPPVSATIGGAGGTIQVSLGSGARFTLTIPEGALSSPIPFTVTPKSAVSGSLGSMTIEPTNILFLKPVTLVVTLAAPLSAADAQLAALSLGTSLAPQKLIMSTSAGASNTSFTATTFMIGSPEPPITFSASLTLSRPAGALAVALTDAEQAQVDLVIANVEKRVAALNAAADQLAATLSFEAAIEYRLQAAALLALIGSDDAVTAAIEAAKANACTKVGLQNDLARTRLGADFRDLWRALRPVISWHAAAASIGVDGTECPAIVIRDDVISDLITEFVTLYTAAMDRPTFVQSADDLQSELHKALFARQYGEPLGMMAEFASLKSKIQLPLAQRLRKASYDWCYNDGGQEYLGRLFRAARDTVMYVPGLAEVPALAQAVNPVADLGATATQLSDDIEYCATSVIARSRDSEGTTDATAYGPVGGRADGTNERTASFTAHPHGEIELDGQATLRICEDEVFSNDRMFIEFNGVRIRELSRVGVTRYFIRNTPTVLKVDSLIAAGNVDANAGGTFDLKLVREGDGCGGAYRLPGEAAARDLVTFSVTIPKVTVTVSPSTASLDAGDSEVFTATVTGTTHTDVTWTVTGGTSVVAGNTLTYTAGNTTGSFTVKATSKEDTTEAGTAGVEIGNGCSASASVARVRASLSIADQCPVISVSVSPNPVSVPPNGTRQFYATVTGTSNQAVTWSATGGTITSTGFFTASPNGGTITITATSVADPTSSGAVDVLVTAAIITLRKATAGVGSRALTYHSPLGDFDVSTDEDFTPDDNLASYSRNTSASAQVSWPEAPELHSLPGGSSVGNTAGSHSMTIRRDSTNSQFLGVDVTGSASASTSATLMDGVAIVQVNAYTLLNGGIALGEEAPNPPSPYLEFRVTGASVTIELTGSCTRSGSGQDINGHTAYSGANVSFYDPAGGARNATGNAEFGCDNYSSNTATGTYRATLLPGFSYRVFWQGTVNTNGITNTSGTMSINFSLKFR